MTKELITGNKLQLGRGGDGRVRPNKDKTRRGPEKKSILYLTK